MTSASLVQFAREFEKKLFASVSSPEQPLGPHDVASLFSSSFNNHPTSEILRNGLHKALFKRTLAHAQRETAFYRRPEYAEWEATAPGEPADLGGLPIINRSQVISNFDSFIAHDVRFSAVSHTSGSTGPALSIYRSTEELRFNYDYYYALIQPQTPLESIPLVLTFPNAFHGVPITLPSLGKVFASGVTDDTLIADAAKVLNTRYKIPKHDERISIISGLLLHIHFFTSYLIEAGHDPRKFGVQSIIVCGGYASRLARRFLTESWGAMVFDRFSLTESVAGASRCPLCDHFHFDPHAIAEVIDVDTGKSLEEGVGRLVLTQLSPFVQMQPLIRYETGDLVRRLRSDCSTSFTIDFLGKEQNAIALNADGKTEWLVWSVDYFEIINEIPDIKALELFSNVRLAKDRSVGSKPIQTIKATYDDSGRATISVNLELRYAPHAFPDRIQELRRKVVDGLRAAQPSLARLMQEGRVMLEVSFAGPGGLKDASTIKV